MIAPAVAVLPDRITVLTCIGCGAMGRQERCDGPCSEHRLDLVSASDYDDLRAAHARSSALRALVTEFARPSSGDAQSELAPLLGQARRTGRAQPRTDWSDPPTLTGWWCAECGNVDLPQPCIGVCVWQPAELVSRTLYEQAREAAEPHLHGAAALTRFLARAAALTPRSGAWERNRQALREQALAALGEACAQRPRPVA